MCADEAQRTVLMLASWGKFSSKYLY